MSETETCADVAVFDAERQPSLGLARRVLSRRPFEPFSHGLDQRPRPEHLDVRPVAQNLADQLTFVGVRHGELIVSVGQEAPGLVRVPGPVVQRARSAVKRRCAACLAGPENSP